MGQSAFEQVEGLRLTEAILGALEADGIQTPSPVQAQGISAVLQGKHVLMHSGTGTGKTLAYLLPLLQRLEDTDTRAVIFAPGTELVMQTLRVANAYRSEAITAAAAVATSSHKRQKKRVQRSTRLVVGTPDRLLEMFRGGKLKGVTLMVFDELEPILAARGSDFLFELLSRSEPKVQIVVATATLGKRTEEFMARFMSDAVVVQSREDNPLQGAIDHLVVTVPDGQGREMTLARFVQEQRCQRAIVFASDPRHQSHLFHYLSEHGHSVATLSHERSKAQRQRALEDFREGRVRLLVTTDAAARGIDVPDVAWVLHYDLPPSPAAYTHRAGRTGRAGKTGSSVVFVDRASQGAVRRLERALDLSFSAARRR